MTIRYASVCSGIEAATVAWNPLGCSCAWLSEIEKFPCAVLKHHYPNTPNLGDMTRITKDVINDHGRIDLLVGGTPCQSFSVAGLRKGMDDPRGNLALEFLRLVDSARPKWVVWENVPGVLSSNNGRDFGAFLGGLVQLGYQWAYRILDAQYFGVAQRRRRVFVVGHLGDWRRAAAVLFERESLSGHPPPRRETGPGVAALTANGVGTCGADDNQAQAGHLIYAPEISPAIKARDHKGPSSDGYCDGAPILGVTHTLRGEGFDASEDGTGRGTPIIPVAFDTKGTDPQPGPVSPTLRSMSHSGSHANAGGQVGVAFQCHGSNVGPMGTLRSGNGNEGGGVPFVVRRGLAASRLTPRECERLQGFPDNYTRIPYRNKPENSCPDGPRYKAIGNSMAVPVMRWIGERIELVEQETKQ